MSVLVCLFVMRKSRLVKTFQVCQSQRTIHAQQPRLTNRRVIGQRKTPPEPLEQPLRKGEPKARDGPDRIRIRVRVRRCGGRRISRRALGHRVGRSSKVVGRVGRSNRVVGRGRMRRGVLGVIIRAPRGVSLGGGTRALEGLGASRRNRIRNEVGTMRLWNRGSNVVNVIRGGGGFDQSNE